MCTAKMAVAEGAFEAGMRAAIFDAAQAGAVPLLDAVAVFEVAGEVLALQTALLSGADSLVALDEGSVIGAEAAAAVLTAVL